MNDKAINVDTKLSDAEKLIELQERYEFAETQVGVDIRELLTMVRTAWANAELNRAMEVIERERAEQLGGVIAAIGEYVEMESFNDGINDGQIVFSKGIQSIIRDGS